jgi:hypothetical protein
MQRIEWYPTLSIYQEGQRPQVADGNYGYGWGLKLTRAAGGRTYYEGRRISPWMAGVTETTHPWPQLQWPVVYEFPKGLVIVDENLTIEGFAFNIDLATSGIRWSLFYTLLDLDQDEMIFLRSSQ